MATKEILFPSGVNRRLSFRQETGRREQYFSPWSVNCRLEDFRGRLRGGSFVPPTASSPPATQSSTVIDANGNYFVNVIGSGGSSISTVTGNASSHSGGVIYAPTPASGGTPVHPAQCVYRDRLFVPNGKVINVSRMGAYSDWSLSSDFSDLSRPTVMQLSEAGEVGKNIVALIPHKDAFLLAATSDSMWVLQGDPVAEGSLRNISRHVGMVGPKAWCRDHLDNYFFLSKYGLYSVSASGEGLQAISEDVIPEDLVDVTNQNTTVSYDHKSRSIYVRIPGSFVSWMYDIENQGFWPFKDGVGSHVAIGPIRLGDGNSYGRLIQLHGMTAAGSVNVTWRIMLADTAEQVAINAKSLIDSLTGNGGSSSGVHSTGVWTPGVNHRSYPRARGKYMMLILSANSGNWAWEGASAVIMPSGAWR